METTTNTTKNTQTLVTDDNAENWSDYPKAQSVGRSLLPVQTNDNDRLVFINLDHPNAQGADLEIADNQALGDALVTVTLDQMVDELRDILEGETGNDSLLKYQSMMEEGELKTVQDFDEFITLRLVVRALVETDQIKDHYMNDAEVRNDVWNGDATATHNEVMSNTCPECFTIRSASGGCNCPQ